jgi:hypothetical protein
METGNLIAMILVGLVLAIVIAIVFDYLICKSKVDSASPCVKKFWRFWISSTSPYNRKVNNYRRKYQTRPMVLNTATPVPVQTYARKPDISFNKTDTVRPFSGNDFEVARAVY